MSILKDNKLLNSKIKLKDVPIRTEPSKWRLKLDSCPVMLLRNDRHSHMRPITFGRKYTIRVAGRNLERLRYSFDINFYTAPIVKPEYNILTLKVDLWSGKINVYFTPYLKYKKFSIKDLKIRPGNQISIEVTTMKPSDWWESARMRCPHEINRIYRRRYGRVYGRTPKKHYVHYLRNTEIRDYVKMSTFMRKPMSRYAYNQHNFNIALMPGHCQPPFWTDL